MNKLYERIKKAMSGLNYQYERLFIDNASTDNTPSKLRVIAAQDKRVKIIFNTRNFGHVRSSVHALFQASGDAVVAMASDLQDPPERIPDFIQKWEDGFPVVIGVKEKTEDSVIFHFLRTLYYRVLRSLSDVQLIENFTGFGLYDKKALDVVREINDPYLIFVV